MTRKIVLVGHCSSDSSYLRLAVNSVSKAIAVVGADDEQSLNRLIDGGADLLLINRVLDYGYTTDHGIDLIRSLHITHPSLKMMLVSNFPDAQKAAVEAGALPGFGKRQLGNPKVGEILRHALG